MAATVWIKCIDDSDVNLSHAEAPSRRHTYLSIQSKPSVTYGQKQGTEQVLRVRGICYVLSFLSRCFQLENPKSKFLGLQVSHLSWAQGEMVMAEQVLFN